MKANTAEAQVSSAFGPALMVSLLFGLCIIFSRGAFSEAAFVTVLSGVVILIGLFTSAALHRVDEVRVELTMLQWVLWAAVFGLAFCAWTDIEQIIYARRPWTGLRTAQAWGLVLLTTYIPAIWRAFTEPQWLRHVRAGLFAVVLVAGGLDTIRTSPRPIIDVWTLQTQGAQLLLKGANPYTDVRVPDTGSGAALPFVPYVYPPTQLYVTLPAQAFFEDVRFAMIAALVILGASLRYIVRRAGRGLPAFLEDAPALAVICMPKLWFIVEQAWVDPVQLALVAASAAALVSRRPFLTAVLFGVVLTAKQTMFWTILAAALTVGFTRKQWAILVGVGAAMVLPFALWNFAALKLSLFDLLSGLPNRPDGLTFNNWSHRHFGYLIPGSAGFALAVVVLGLSKWRLAASPAGFGLALSLTYTLFFTFNRWAFANYYFTLASLAALAAALSFHATLNAPAVPVSEPART